jgi:hypothetical protein
MDVVSQVLVQRKGYGSIYFVLHIYNFRIYNLQLISQFYVFDNLRFTINYPIVKLKNKL